MKIRKFMAIFLMVVFSSAGLFAAKKGKQQKVKIEIVNRPGMALGSEIPDWVIAVT